MSLTSLCKLLQSHTNSTFNVNIFVEVIKNIDPAYQLRVVWTIDLVMSILRVHILSSQCCVKMNNYAYQKECKKVKVGTYYKVV